MPTNRQMPGLFLAEDQDIDPKPGTGGTKADPSRGAEVVDPLNSPPRDDEDPKAIIDPKTDRSRGGDVTPPDEA